MLTINSRCKNLPYQSTFEPFCDSYQISKNSFKLPSNSELLWPQLLKISRIIPVISMYGNTKSTESRNFFQSISIYDKIMFYSGREKYHDFPFCNGNL